MLRKKLFFPGFARVWGSVLAVGRLQSLGNGLLASSDLFINRHSQFLELLGQMLAYQLPQLGLCLLIYKRIRM